MSEEIANWLIISWKHDSLEDAYSGKLLTVVNGTAEQAKDAAWQYMSEHKPVGIVKEIV